MDAMNARNVLNMQFMNADESSEGTTSTCENNAYCVKCEQLKRKLSLLETSMQNVNELIALKNQTNEDKVQSYETRIKKLDEKIESLESNLKMHAEKLSKPNEFDQLPNKLSIMEISMQNCNELIALKYQIKNQDDKIESLESELKMQAEKLSKQVKMQSYDTKVKNQDDKIKSLESELKMQAEKLSKQVKMQSYDTKVKNQDDKIKSLESELKMQAEKLKEQSEFLKKCNDQIVSNEANIKDNQKEIIKMNETSPKITAEQNDIIKEYKATINELQEKIAHLQTEAKLDATKFVGNDNLSAEYKKHDKTATCIPFEGQSTETNLKIVYRTGKEASRIRLKFEDTIAGPGWIIVLNNNIIGKHIWEREHVSEFGDPNENYWLGLDNIHILTNDQQHELYIHLVGLNDEVRYARYDNFVISGKEWRFILKSLGKYSGNAGDAMRCHEGQIGNCYWWGNNFNDCFLTGEHPWWRNVANGQLQSLKSVKMLIKPKL